LAEQQTLNLRVVGSIPTRLTIRLTFSLIRGEPKVRSWQATIRRMP